jgi:uncharacterized membrane protein YsdA (DUF1294 family)/cold shock CspA family protein
MWQFRSRMLSYRYLSTLLGVRFRRKKLRYRGKITEWRDIRGFGFITPDDGGDRVFVHLNAFRADQQRPQGRERVTYQLGRDTRGRVCAANVEFTNPRLRRSQLSATDRAATGLAVLFVAILAAAALAGWLSWVGPALYVGMSLATYYTYSADKAAAERGQWRTSEGTLLLWGLLGGWPGAVIAQRVRRHKSRKQPFQFFFWLTVLLNCGALAGVGTAVG